MNLTLAGLGMEGLRWPPAEKRRGLRDKRAVSWESWPTGTNGGWRRRGRGLRSGWVRQGPVEWVPGPDRAAPGALPLPWQIPSRPWVLRTALISPCSEPLKRDMGP